jgi:L-asparaginase II
VCSSDLALPLLLAGAEARFDLTPADLALICASHGGEREHVERAASLLERGGFTEADLLCGAHRPFDLVAQADLAAAGRPPSPLHNNCSGKHAGMLLACRLLGLPAAGYVEPEHPWQARILRVVADLCAWPAERIGVGIDGCSVPAYRLPLAAAARGYAVLAHPEGAGRSGEERAALERIAAAMTGEPRMVAGTGRFTTRLMEVTGGRVLGKEGAEGFYAVAVRGPVALGIAVKVADGDAEGRCRDGVVIDVLRQLGSLSAAETAELAPYHRPVLYNHRRLRVGEVVPDLELEEVE